MSTTELSPAIAPGAAAPPYEIGAVGAVATSEALLAALATAG